MPVSDNELRDLVRESVVRHLGIDTPSPIRNAAAGSRHASHLLLPVAPGSGEGDGLCVIEPTVRCNHCGYCQSYGH